MDAAKTVTASYALAPTTFTLTVLKAGAGVGTVTALGGGITCGSDCTEPYAAGRTVTLTASAGVGSLFAGWSGACSGAGACTLTMDAAKSLTATFETPQSTTQTLNVSKNGTGSGTVSSTPAGITCGTDSHRGLRVWHRGDAERERSVGFHVLGLERGLLGPGQLQRADGRRQGCDRDLRGGR